jgi:rod shape-determining protein MreD
VIGALRLLALGVALLAGQALVVRLLPEAFRPDLVLVFALAMGVRRNSATLALGLAFGFGFAFDVLTGSPGGLYALLRGTACVATRALDRALYLRAPVPWGLYAAGWTLADWTLMALVLRILRPEALPTWGEALLRAPGSALATALAAALLLGVFRRIEMAEERDTSWSVLSPSGSRR